MTATVVALAVAEILAVGYGFRLGVPALYTDSHPSAVTYGSDATGQGGAVVCCGGKCLAHVDETGVVDVRVSLDSLVCGVAA